MRGAIVTLLALGAMVSCAQDKAAVPATPQARAVVAQLRVERPPDSMPDAERIALEAAAMKVVASGPAAVPGILSDLETNRSEVRRDALERLLALITVNASEDAGPRSACDKAILEAEKKTLASSDASDRRLGLMLAGLESESRAMPDAITLLGDSDPGTRSAAFSVLQGATGFDFGFRADAGEDVRKAAVKRWNEWWDKNKNRQMYSSHTPSADPVLAAFAADLDEISRSAGQYVVSVTDKATGKAIGGAIVAYSYSFRTPDNSGYAKKDQGVTDDGGNYVMAKVTTASGTRFLGAQVIISKAGYKQENITFAPHLLTTNAFAAQVALEPEAK